MRANFTLSFICKASGPYLLASNYRTSIMYCDGAHSKSLWNIKIMTNMEIERQFNLYEYHSYWRLFSSDLIAVAIAAIALPPQLQFHWNQMRCFTFNFKPFTQQVPKINVLTIEIMVNEMYLSCSHCTLVLSI
jgi:hypothetical protein